MTADELRGRVDVTLAREHALFVASLVSDLVADELRWRKQVVTGALGRLDALRRRVVAVEGSKLRCVVGGETVLGHEEGTAKLLKVLVARQERLVQHIVAALGGKATKEQFEALDRCEPSPALDTSEKGSKDK